MLRQKEIEMKVVYSTIHKEDILKGKMMRNIDFKAV